MQLRIGQIGPLNVPIPPKKYGGTERIIDALCRGLSRRGHRVFLFAAKDSRTRATLVPVLEQSLWEQRIIESTPYYGYEMSVVARASRRLKLDVLHDHLGPWSLALYGSVATPIVHTLHVPLNKDRVWAYRKLNARLVSISNTQRAPAPDLRYAATIYNGIDVNAYPYRAAPRNYFLFLGELAERKGIAEAITVAKHLNVPLVVAGRIPKPSQKKDHEFFQRTIKPQLNRGRIRYVGEVNGKRAAALYGGAIATLFPIRWEEPFGLVMIESMSCGTPVIAFRRGSVPEVIAHGKTGFIVRTIHEMAEAARHIEQIDRRTCRLHVERNFSVDQMTDRYEQLFLRLAHRQRGHSVLR